jgi:hypothetical protein
VDYDHLSRADKATYNRAIRQTHERRIEVDILTLDGRLVRSLSPRIIAGQVDVDSTRDPSRILNMTFVDKAQSLNFEPDSAGDAPLHRKYKIRVVDSRRIVALGAWIDCVIFTGPLMDFERTGAEVSITAHGVEELCSGTIRTARTFPRKFKTTDAIKWLLSEAGATGYHIPDLPNTLPDRVSVVTVKDKKGKPVEDKKGHEKKRKVHKGYRAGVDHTYISLATDLAEACNRHLFANARGRFDMRPFPTKPVLTLDKELISDLTTKRPIDGVPPNVVVVLGANPKGPKKRVQARAAFPKSHPLSKESLAWNGKPFEVEERIENRHLKTNAAAKAVAQRRRDDHARVVVEYGVDILPYPWLAEEDLVSVVSRFGRVTIRMRQWSIPLGPSADPMTIGSLRRGAGTKAPRKHGGHTRFGHDSSIRFGH